MPASSRASSSKRRVALSRDEVQRAIYIDFEGTATEPASFLGVYCDGAWEVWIIEESLHGAAVHHKNGQVTASDRQSVITSLRSRALDERRRIIAWSDRELQEILKTPGINERESRWWTDNLVNALPPAKRWANRNRVEIPVVGSSRGLRPNKWSLSGFRRATGYRKLSSAHETGNTASRIRTVREQLAKRGSYSKLTKVAKGKWTKVLTHNYHDCVGLQHVVNTIFEPESHQINL